MFMRLFRPKLILNILLCSAFLTAFIFIFSIRLKSDKPKNVLHLTDDSSIYDFLQLRSTKVHSQLSKNIKSLSTMSNKLTSATLTNAKLSLTSGRLSTQAFRKSQLTTTTPEVIHPDRKLAIARMKKIDFFYPIISLEEKKIMMLLLTIFHYITQKHNITYMMYGGTLLGSYRHHDLIPWDDDIDLLVRKSDRIKLGLALKSVAPDVILAPAGGHDKIYHKTSKRTSKYIWRWPYLDVSFFEENATHIWDHQATYNHWFVYSRNATFPLHTRPFGDIWLPSPHDTLSFLQLTYGMTTLCKTSSYSHMIEDSVNAGRLTCDKLSHFTPFVHHSPCVNKKSRNCVRETLVLNFTVQRVVEVGEPSYALAQPYSLLLQKGFTAPSFVPKVNFTDL